MIRTRILSILLAAMLSVCAGTAALPAAAYAAEPAEQAEDVSIDHSTGQNTDKPDSGETSEEALSSASDEAEDPEEPADEEEIPDRSAETAKQPKAADRRAAEELPGEEEQLETVEQPEMVEQPESAEQFEEADRSETAEQPEDAEGQTANGQAAEGQSETEEEHAAEGQADTAAADAALSDQPGEEHHLAFASDYHRTEGSIRNALEGMPEDVEYVCLIGDMVGERGGDHPEYDSREILELVREVFPALDNESVSIVWGSHDMSVNDEGTGIVKCMDGVSEPIREGLNQDGSPAYYIYGVGHYDMTSGDERSEGAAAAFKEWVRGLDHTVPVIVLCHVPIQASRGDNNGASYWNEALNYAATGVEGITAADPLTNAEIIRNVLFLHGHNHTNDPAEYYFGAGTRLSYQADHSADQPAVYPTGQPAEYSTGPNAEGPRPWPPRIVDGVLSDIYYTSLTAGYLKTSGNATLVTVADGALVLTKYHGDQTVSLGIDGNTKEPVGETMTIAAQRHAEGEGVRENVEAPTCERGGTYDLVVYCAICGKELHRTQIETEAAGHRWGEWTVVRAATVKAEGRKERTCSVCGKTQSRAIPMTSPEHSEDPEQPEKPEQSEEPGKSGSPEEQGRSSSSTKPGRPKGVEPGTAVKRPETASSPQTGDHREQVLWVAIMGLSVISLAVAAAARRAEERG